MTHRYPEGRTRRVRKTALAALALLLAPLAAQAATFAPLTGQQVLQQFNLVVLGNGQTTSDVEGRIYVQGNFTTGNLVQRQMPVSDYAAVTTGGNLTSSTVDNNYNDANGNRPVGVVVRGNITGATVNNGGGAILGNASNTHFNGNTGGTYIGGTATNVNRNSGTVATLASSTRLSNAVDASTSTNFAQVMGDLSTQLQGLAANSSASVSGNRVTFNATPDANGLAVFNVTSSLLGLGEFQFNLNGAKTVIFDSDVSSATINANFLGGIATTLGQQAIWNFYNATSLTLGSQFGGAILAPHATLTNTNNIEGAVVVQSFDGKGEIHLQSFSGQVPGGNNGTATNQVPEPGTVSLVACSLIGLVLVRRRPRPPALPARA